MKQNLKIFYIFAFSLVLMVVLSSCASLEKFASLQPQQLSAKDESRLGSAVEKRLLQLLGGRYQDAEIAAEIRRLGKQQGVVATVADSNSAAIYGLPAGYVVVSRGALTQIDSPEQLKTMLHGAAALSRTAMQDNSSWAMSNAVNEFLAATPSAYDPDAADIRAAELFAENPCEAACLGKLQKKSGKGKLPKAIAALKETRPGYDKLSEAKRLEKSGDAGAAISAYLQAATDAPDQARILSSLGTAYLRQGDLQSARLHLEKANRLQPDYYKSLMGLGYIYLQSKKVDRAKTVLAKSVKLLPVTENLFLLAEALERGGDFKEAKRLYQLVVDRDRFSKLGKTAKQRLQRLENR